MNMPARMMDPSFPLYVVSKGRWKQRHTVKALEAQKVPYKVIIEEQEYKDYASVIDPKNLLVLDKQYQRDYDTADDLGDSVSKGAGPARNFAWEHSMAENHEWHWVMDDNINHFYRWNKNAQHVVNDGAFWRAMEDFCLRYKNVAMAGPHYHMFLPSKVKRPPFLLNRRIYSCNLIRNDMPFRWRARLNEDTDLSLRMLKAGWCTILFHAFLQGKMATQQVGGGNTKEFYADEGTLHKSQILVNLHPDVSRLVWRFDRWHHHVDYSPFEKNHLVKKDPEISGRGTDDYGMRLAEKRVITKEIDIKGAKVLVREETSDEFIAREVIGSNEYRKLKIAPDDVVADIGFNIGSFSIWAIRQGAKEIHAYEPDAENFRIAEHNLGLNNYGGYVTSHKKAVIGNDDETREFAINVKRNKGCHSLIYKKGRDVECVDCININKILEEVKPTVMKLDIEGGEYECLKSIKSFDGVREIILEFHHAHLNDVKTHEKYIEILDLLRANFEVVEARDPSVLGGAWTCIVYCKKAA